MLLLTGIFVFRKKFRHLSRLDVLLLSLLYIIVSIAHYFISMASLDLNMTSSVVIKQNILSEEQCKAIISSAEIAAGKRGEWQTTRHKSYPTTDISAYAIKEDITLGGKVHKFGTWMNATVQDTILPIIAAEFSVTLGDLFMKDLFIVKYDIEGQRSLPEHRDSSQITFGIALNQIGEDFVGGGTRFVLTNEPLTAPQGYMIIHDSRLYHAGHPITSGTRYILIGFVNVYSSYRNWWRAFGATATCLHLPPRPPDIVESVVCRSWLWTWRYSFQKGLRDALDPLLHLSSREGGGAGTQHSAVSWVILGVLGVLLMLMGVIVCAFLSLCLCGDDFNAYYCYYVIMMLTPIERLVDPELATYTASRGVGGRGVADGRDIENCPLYDCHFLSVKNESTGSGHKGRYKDL